MSRNRRPGCALVTGGAVRLGRELALALAEDGWDIALHFRSSREAAKETALEIEKRGVHCGLFQFDFQGDGEPADLVGEVQSRFPDLALLVNNASAYRPGNIAATDGGLLDEMLNVNFRAPFFLSRAFAERCSGGNIVNIIDNKVAHHQFQYSAYLLSKKLLAEFTALAALEFAPRIRVNGIAPGVILPAADRSADYLRWRREGIPLRRQGKPCHVAAVLRFILENDFLTGQILTVDGGESLTGIGRNAVDYTAAPATPTAINRCIVAVGSNIRAEENVRRAREILAADKKLLDESRFRRTHPVGFQEQDDFLNGAFLLETPEGFEELKEYLHDVENRLGRVRTAEKSGPRTMDLDLVVWNDLVVHRDFYSQAYIRDPVEEIVWRNEIRLQHPWPGE